MFIYFVISCLYFYFRLARCFLELFLYDIFYATILWYLFGTLYIQIVCRFVGVNKRGKIQVCEYQCNRNHTL